MPRLEKRVLDKSGARLVDIANKEVGLRSEDPTLAQNRLKFSELAGIVTCENELTGFRGQSVYSCRQSCTFILWS